MNLHLLNFPPLSQENNIYEEMSIGNQIYIACIGNFGV